MRRCRQEGKWLTRRWRSERLRGLFCVSMAFNTMERGGEVPRVITKRSDNHRINPFHAHTIISTISGIMPFAAALSIIRSS